jgi:hypothetical protein
VAILDDDTVAISGRFYGTVDFGGGNITATGAAGVTGATDSFVAAYSSTIGAYIWLKKLGGSDNLPSYIVASEGDVFVATTLVGTVTLEGNVLLARGAEDILLARFHGADGAHMWSRTLQQSTPQDQVMFARSIATDGSHIFVGGAFSHTANLGSGDMTATGRVDALVASYNASDGTYVWDQQFGGEIVTQAVSIAVNPMKFVVNILFSNETITIGTETFTAVADDVALVRLNPSTGALVLAQHFGTPGNDDMALVYAFGRLFGVGTFLTSVDLFGTRLLSYGGNDIAVFRFDF